MAINLPRFYSTKALPGTSGLVPISPGMASKPYEALSRAGEKIEGLGQHAANVFDILNKAEEAVNADKIGHEIDDEYEQKNLTYLDRADHINFEKDAKAFNDMSLQKWLSDPRIKDNPRLGQAIEKHLRNKSSGLMSGMRRQKAILIGQEGEATWNRDKIEATGEWGRAIDLIGKEIAKEKLTAKGRFFVNRGVISKIKFDVDMQAFDGDAEKSELITLTNINPQQAIINIDKGVYKTFSNTELAQRKVLAQNELEVQNKKKEAEKEKLIFDSSYYTVKKDWGSNYEMMIKSLSDVGYLKKNNIPIDIKNRLVVTLKAEESLFYGDIQNDFLSKLQAGTLTELEVQRSKLPATSLGQGDKNWFIEKLNAKRVKGDEAFIHSNPRVYGETLRSIVLSPGKWDKNKIWALMGISDDKGSPMGLDPRDTAQLWKLWEDLSKTDPAIAKKYGALPQAVDRLEEYRNNAFFVELSGAVDNMGKPIITREEVIKNDQAHYLALQQLQERVAKGEDPFTALSEIMKKPTEEKAKSWYDKWWGNVNAWFPSAPKKLLTPKPSSPPQGNKEGRYDVNGVIWNWSKAKGWYQ